MLPELPDNAIVTFATGVACSRTQAKEVHPMAGQRARGNAGNFAVDREKASQAGRVGGRISPGNFANNRERAAEAGRKGGALSNGGGGASNNPGNFARDPERAAAAGRIGGKRLPAKQEGRPEAAQRKRPPTASRCYAASL
jgi:general stress protein YciG